MFQYWHQTLTQSDQIEKHTRSIQTKQIIRIVLVLLISVSMLSTSCSLFSKAVPIEVIETNPEHHFLTLNELTAAASLIIQGEVISSESWIDEETVYTRSVIKVSRGFKGQAGENSQVTVIDFGGVVEKNKARIDIRPDGIPALKKDQLVFLFLESFSGESNQQAFTPLGIYQGKFLLDQNVVKQQAPESYQLTEQPPITAITFSAQIIAFIISQQYATKYQ